jgi:hypothetical protein
MKTRLFKLITLSFLFFMLVLSGNSHAQRKEKKGEMPVTVQQMVDAKQFLFVAQTVNPSRGSLRQLTSGYDLRLSKDSLVTMLPFFGRAYTASIDPRDNGIQFTSVQYDYDIKKKKKGWEITLKPRDVENVQQLFLTVFNNGRANLQVVSNNRESISFSGLIEKL